MGKSFMNKESQSYKTRFHLLKNFTRKFWKVKVKVE